MESKLTKFRIPLNKRRLERKKGRLLGMGKFHVDSANTLAFFLKYGGAVTTQVPRTHHR